jgi:hypothetical protein
MTPLFETSANSQAVEPSGKTAKIGPFVLAAASEKSGSRAVIISSASLATAEGLRCSATNRFCFPA